MARVHGKVIESSDSDDNSHEDERANPPVNRTGPARGSKSKAAEAWQLLKRSSKGTQGATNAKKRANESEKPKKPAKAQFSAPEIDLDTSDDDSQSGLAHLSKSSKSKSSSQSNSTKRLASKSPSTVPDKVPASSKADSGATSTPAPRKKSTTVDLDAEEVDSSNDESEDEEKEEDGDGDGDESSGESEDEKLKRMNPRALEAMMNAEAATIVGDDNDGDAVNSAGISHDDYPGSQGGLGAEDESLLGKSGPAKRHRKSVISAPVGTDEADDDIAMMSESQASAPPKKKKKKSKGGTAQAVAEPKKSQKERAKRDTNGVKGRGEAPAAAAAKRKRTKSDESLVWRDELVTANKEISSDTEEAPAKRPRKKGSLKPVDPDELSEVSSDEDEDDGNDSGIELVLPAKGRISLREQHTRIKKVAAATITDLLVNVCIKNAFPEGDVDRSVEIGKRALIKTAKSYGYDDLVKRLKKDKIYAAKLASIPMQRIPNFRGKVKKATDSAPPNIYGLLSGDVDRLRWLQDDERYIYICSYEGDTVDGTKPYKYPVFAQTLRMIFFCKSRSFGYQLIPHFVSSLPEKPNEKEIPAPMLALVATALYASIEDYRSTQYNVGEFKTSLFLEAYRSNIHILSELQNENLPAYHTLMHNLYKDACTAGTTAGPARKPKKSFLKAKDMPVE